MIWESLGFRQSPLFAEPIDIDPSQQHLFVGRRDEIDRLAVSLALRRGGVIPVGGIPGCGKTSLVNRFRYLLKANNLPAAAGNLSQIRVAVAERTIQLIPTDDVASVLRKALGSVAYACIRHCKENRHRIPKIARQLNQTLNEVVNEGRSFGFGFNFFGYGGNINHSKSQATASLALNSDDVLARHFKEMVDVLPKLDVDAILLIIDNVELLGDEKLLGIVNVLRDSVFNHPRVWWILLGRDGLGGLLASKAPRLRGYMPTDGVDVGPMTPEEVLETLRTRISFFRTRPDADLPIPESVVRSVYSASNGDLRFTFSFLQRALLEASMEDKLEDMRSEETWADLVKKEIERHFGLQRTNNEGLWRVMRRIVEFGSASLMASDFQKYQMMSTTEFRLVLDEMSELEMLWKVRSISEDQYLPRGHLELARQLMISDRERS
jgi:hypothetical protein